MSVGFNETKSAWLMGNQLDVRMMCADSDGAVRLGHVYLSVKSKKQNFIDSILGWWAHGAFRGPVGQTPRDIHVTSCLTCLIIFNFIIEPTLFSTIWFFIVCMGFVEQFNFLMLTSYHSTI